MTISSLSSEERAELEYLCAWLSTQKSDVFKNPHTILRAGLDAPKDWKNETLADPWPRPMENLKTRLEDISRDAWSGERSKMNSIGRTADAILKEIFPNPAHAPGRNADVKQAHPYGQWSHKLEVEL